MIARGDLAVECGYQRLAEVQEEILWISEAAHVPVIWATQVLETLAKKGMPERHSGDYTGGRYVFVESMEKLGVLLNVKHES